MDQQAREKLVEMLKAVGQDLIDNADTYIPINIAWLQSIDFTFGFQAGGPDIEVPSLSISADFAQKDVLDVLMNAHDNKNR